MKEFVNQIAEHSVLCIGFLIAMFCVILFIVILTKLIEQERKDQDQAGEEDNLYQLLSDNSFQVYIVVRKKDMFPVFISDNIEQILGLEKQDVKVDLSALEWIIEEEEKDRFKKLWNSRNKEESFVVDLTCNHFKTGERQYMLFHVEENRDNEYAMILLQDINKQKKAEFDLRKQLNQAEQDNKAKTEFLSKMSHEIRTPMNGILGMLELARMDMDHKEKVTEYLDKADNLSKYLLGLINDILDLTRIESGKTELVCEPFDLYVLAEKLRSMFQQTTEEKGIVLRVEIEDFEEHWVQGDEMRLSQVIVNFLSNAVKFTESGGEICVTFRQMQKIDDTLHLMVRVRDNGKGIEPEFLSSIFKPFEQEDNKIARKYGGSGLGMAIADNIIRLMGGQIIIDSEVGKGSDFTVLLSLPIAGKEKMEDTSGYPAYEDTLSEEQLMECLAGVHVILAEDNDINARISVKLLEKDGMIVDRAVNGRKAVEMFAGSPERYYDVILMDIQMPELNGWDATRQIRSMDRQDAKTIPIYALSANAFAEDKRQSMEAGMNGHISKPIDFKELRKILGIAIRDNHK